MRLIWISILVYGSLSQLPLQDPIPYLKTFNENLSKIENMRMTAQWNYQTNMTNETRKTQGKVLSEVAKLHANMKNQTREIFGKVWKQYKNETIRRQFQQIMAKTPEDILTVVEYKKMLEHSTKVKTIYSSAKLNGSSLDPDLVNIMANSRDPEELEYTFIGWRNVSGAKLRQDYIEYIKLYNKGYKLAIMKLSPILDYSSAGEALVHEYEMANFTRRMEALLNELKPYYQQLHAYVRRKLREFYGQKYFVRFDQIPAHLLGNMWSQEWNNIYDLVVPFPNKTTVDVTSTMVKQGWTPLKMFNVSEEFFMSLGFNKMPSVFWNKSMFTRPERRSVVCHASAWDLFDRKDFRIKMCTKVNMMDLGIVHHEMGHVQYYSLYKDQPALFRRGANPAFHEAVGDLIGLSVTTPEYLTKIGLLKSFKSDHETDLNYLMLQALRKIAFLPFGYIIDRWRWDLYRTEDFKNMNREWWKLRCKYQGIMPPVRRTENDFDPGSKYHIPNATPYIRYFISFIIQFQFQEALCKKIRKTQPLHHCDIYKSKTAGRILRKALSLGSSRPWPEVMELITGQREISVKPLIKYFQPLFDFLEEDNRKYGEPVGWHDKCLPEFLPDD